MFEACNARALVRSVALSTSRACIYVSWQSPRSHDHYIVAVHRKYNLRINSFPHEMLQVVIFPKINHLKIKAFYVIFHI